MKTKLIFLLLLASFDSYSQDLYNYENSVLFGKYLYSSNQLDLAAQEFERCVFLKPEDRESYLYLCKVYRKTNEFDKAVNTFQRFNGKVSFQDMDPAFSVEYLKLLVQNGKYQDATEFLEKNSILRENSDYKLSSFLLRKDWKDAYKYQASSNIPINKTLLEINNQGVQLKKKSPLLAGLLSVCIPGAGKVYAGRWKDGIISLFMTSSAAFFSVRGFKNNGNGFYPWFLGTMAVMYYSGNIYGSTQAVIKYNKLKEDELVEKTRSFILTDN
ncbi:MAG: hypothetical protein M1292_02935 [Bacteroidetes bacterium]|nr:hypothetical protein [Bacteroidota bacterium]